jgi:hypothetical protein
MQRTKNHGHNNFAAWTVSRTRTGEVKALTEYVDTATGEIIPASEVQMLVLDLRDKQVRKDAVLGSLHPKVREFAYFVLDYANKRRGITPGINTLCRWYAVLVGMRADNVRRYIPQLQAANILASENRLGPLFQRTGGSRWEHGGEDLAALEMFWTKHKTGVRGPLRRGLSAKGDVDADRVMLRIAATAPAWLADAAPTGNLFTYEAYCELMERVGLPACRTPQEVAWSHAEHEPPLLPPPPKRAAPGERPEYIPVRRRIKGLSMDDVRLLLSAYFGSYQRQRLHAEVA